MNDRRINHKKLCVMGLDENTNEKELRAMCKKFTDFYRTKNNPGLVFTEFEHEKDAELVKKDLIAAGFKVNYAFLRDDEKNGTNKREGALIPKSIDLETSEEDIVIQRIHNPCSACKETAFLTCGRCGAFYCTENCQASDWLKHKNVCFPMPKLVPAPLLKDPAKVEPKASIDAPDGRRNPFRRTETQPPQPATKSSVSPKTRAGVERMFAMKSPEKTEAASKPLVKPSPPASPTKPMAKLSVKTEPTTKPAVVTESNTKSPFARALAMQAPPSPPAKAEPISKSPMARALAMQAPPSPPAKTEPISKSPMARALAMQASQPPPVKAEPIAKSPIAKAMALESPPMRNQRDVMPKAQSPPRAPATLVPKKMVPPPIDDEYASDGSRSPQPIRSPSTKRFLAAMRKTPSVHSMDDEYEDPLVVDKDTIIISHVVSHCSLYVQPMSKQEELAKLQIELNAAVINAPSLAKYPACGDLVAAPFEGEFYRGRVISVDLNTDIVKISYIDYGNMEEIQFCFIKQLPDAFIKMRRMSMRVSLAGIDTDIDSTEASSIKRDLVKSMETPFIINCAQKNIEMNAAITLINGIDESSLNETMLEQISSRFKVDDLLPKVVNGTDLKVVIYDASNLENGMLTCFLESDRPAVVAMETCLDKLGKKILTAPAHVPRPHELCLVKEMDGKTVYWTRAAFEQELIENRGELVKLDYMKKARVSMNNIRAYDKSVTRDLFTFTCKIKGSGKCTIDELQFLFKDFQTVKCKSIQYIESRGAHIIDVA